MSMKGFYWITVSKVSSKPTRMPKGTVRLPSGHKIQAKTILCITDASQVTQLLPNGHPI